MFFSSATPRVKRSDSPDGTYAMFAVVVKAVVAERPNTGLYVFVFLLASFFLGEEERARRKKMRRANKMLEHALEMPAGSTLSRSRERSDYATSFQSARGTKSACGDRCRLRVLAARFRFCKRNPGVTFRT